MLTFLATVATFYLLLGLLAAAGVAAFSDPFSQTLKTNRVEFALLAVGLAMIVVAFRLGRCEQRSESGRLAKWRERAVNEDDSVRGIVTLGLIVVLIEAGSMVLYVAVIALLGTTEPGWTTTLLVLAGYCLVMVLPAAVLLAGRLVAAKVAEPWLHKINDGKVPGIERTTWVVGLIGLLLASKAMDGLGVLTQINEWS